MQNTSNFKLKNTRHSFKKILPRLLRNVVIIMDLLNNIKISVLKSYIEERSLMLRIKFFTLTVETEQKIKFKVRIRKLIIEIRNRNTVNNKKK